jgi:hypothetical protein
MPRPFRCQAFVTDGLAEHGVYAGFRPDQLG